MTSPLRSINDVVDWHLCIGCGACAYICPDQQIKLLDFPTEGIRPAQGPAHCGDCKLCLDVCPAVQSDFSILPRSSSGSLATNSEKNWGPIVGMWEGYATDSEIRSKGSSGGALTALSAYCQERLGMSGTLHIAQDPDDPTLNRTRLSTSRASLLQATGSRYSPASVCNGLALVEKSPTPCVIIGKPAEISAVANARRLRPQLAQKIGVTMSFFCAETPSTHGTLSLLKKLQVNVSALGDLRYRGIGWPGHFAPTRRGADKPDHQITYGESWAFLQAYRPWSVQLWPDGAGELADIACGDPWYEKPDGINPGSSLIVARTSRGREIVEGAIMAGYLSATNAEHWKLEKSQPGLLSKKGAVWGRRLALRLFGLPVTKLKGLDLRHCWKPLNLQDKLRATLGTARRILTRKIYRRARLDHTDASFVKPAFVSSAKDKSSPEF